MTIAQVVECLNTTERHIRRLVFLHEIPYVKVGGKVRFQPAELEAWVLSNTVGVGSPPFVAVAP